MPTQLFIPTLAQVRRSSARFLILWLTFSCTACNSKAIEEHPVGEMPVPMYQPPLKPGQVLDRTTDYGRKWTGIPALFKLSETLLLQIPPMYQGFWNQDARVIRPPTDLSKLPKSRAVAFSFFMPDFSGYTPENYRHDFDEDRVDVVEIKYEGMGEEQPDAPGAFPPNMFKRAITLNGKVGESYEEHFGLRCYHVIVGNNSSQLCYGLKDPASNEYIMLDVMFPPYGNWIKYPQMQANYFTTKYGGVSILWRANMKHFSHWQDIDRQIWKFVEEWKLIGSGQTTRH